MFSVIESCKHLLIGLNDMFVFHPSQLWGKETPRGSLLSTTCCWAPELSLGVVVKKVRTVGWPWEPWVLKSHCFLFFSSWFPNGLMQQQLLPTPPTCALESNPTFQAGAALACAGWQKCFVNVTVGMQRGWISRRVVMVEFEFGVCIDFLVHRIRLDK